MKIRLGFVSNSSSSSYYVTLPLGEKAFAEDMMIVYGWDYFDKKEIVKKVDDYLAQTQKEVEDEKKQKLLGASTVQLWWEGAQRVKKNCDEALAKGDVEYESGRCRKKSDDSS